MFIKICISIINYENRYKFLPPNISGVDKRRKENMEEQHNKMICTGSWRSSC